jgi:hypothetical protein
MSDAVKQQVAPAKVTKQVKKTTKVEAKHPKFREMVLEAINKLAERTGSSRQAILKYIVANFHIEEKLANQHIKTALKQGVKQGWLEQIKGVGASGSFRVADAVKVTKKADAPKTVKPKTAKVSAEPKKNVTKIIKSAVPKPVAAPKAKVAAPAVAAKKPVAAPKKVVKKAALAKAAPAKKAAPVTKATPVKKPTAASKKVAVKKAAPAKATTVKKAASVKKSTRANKFVWAKRVRSIKFSRTPIVDDQNNTVLWRLPANEAMASLYCKK